MHLITLSGTHIHTHTHTHTHTQIRTPLDEGSARCTDLYLTAQKLATDRHLWSGGVRTRNLRERPTADLHERILEVILFIIQTNQTHNIFLNNIFYFVSTPTCFSATVSSSGSINPYPTAFSYGNGMVLHFYQQQESSTTKTVYKVINKGLKTYV